MMNIKTYVIIWLAKVILKTMSDSTKKIFRKLEKNVSKLVKNEAHLGFNLTCFNSNLLPIYTNFTFICKYLFKGTK